MAWAIFCRAAPIGSLEPGRSRSDRVSPKTLKPTSCTVKPGTISFRSTDLCHWAACTGGAAGLGGAAGCGLTMSMARSSQGLLLARPCCPDACCVTNHLRRKTKSTTYCRDCDNRSSRLHVQDLFVAELAVIDRMRFCGAGLRCVARGILPAWVSVLATGRMRPHRG